MKIYINGRFLLQNQTGINRFAYELCKGMKHNGMDFILICPNGKIRDCYDVSSFCIKRFGYGSSHIWEQVQLPIYFLSRKGEKILINFSGIGPVMVKNKIMTIHDLAFLHNPSWYSFAYRLIYKNLTPLGAKTSRKIITVSDFSKREIIKFLGIDGDKIEIVSNAVSQIFTEGNQVNKTRSQEKYILTVSSVDPRKNFATLLKAFSMINDSSLKLYIIGGESKIYTTSIKCLFKSGQNDNIKWLGRVPDSKLKQYYKNAACFIYPSLYEGFGIPPLEAMACGTPTIVSDIPPLREVCGEASVFVDPNNPLEIAETIISVVNDEEKQMFLRTAGIARWRMYNWIDSSLKVKDIIESV